MLLECKIRMRSHMLGEIKSKEGARRFRRTDNGDIAIPHMKWIDSLVKAAKDHGKELNREAIMFPEGFTPPTIVLHIRTYNRTKKEMFECIRKGTVITFDCIIREDLENCVSLDEFKSIMATVGAFYGFSEWGCKFGFGRFDVHSITHIKT